MVELDGTKVCADCGATDPEWASINRGVFICTECCYVHRSLGRHISQIRSLSKGVWCSSQLELLNTLYWNGANNVWEHSLLDPHNQSKSKKKPMSNDPVIPKKEAFIKMKYEQLAYTIRPSKEETNSLSDLNRQLWSCVRTSHVETTLRLLALGANPNFADPDKGNTPLHVAAKEGQLLQIELLWIYGADVAQKNTAGLIPMEVAKMEKNHDLAARLEELEFDVTDRLAMFLCGRRPDHVKGVHFMVPEMASPISENVKQFRKQLIGSSCVLFEKLIQDVYDEVDRREVTAQWNSVQSSCSMGIYDPKHVAVFLPPNAGLSATRNQLRQKLAKYDSRELSVMIVDLLKEAKRRYLNLPFNDDTPDPSSKSWVPENQDKDYDDVADIDHRKSRGSSSTRRSSGNKLSDLEEKDRRANSMPTLDDFLELREKWRETNQKLGTVIQTNLHMAREMQSLHKTVEQLCEDRSDIQRTLKAIQDSLATISRRTATSPINVVTSPAISPVPRWISGQKPLADHSRTGTTDSRFSQRHGSLTNPVPDFTGYQRFESPRNSSAPPSDASDFGPSSIKQPIQSENPYFPDSLIGETEHLIVAIKKLLSDLQINGPATNAVLHADAIDYHIQRIIKSIPTAHGVIGLQACVDDITTSMNRLSFKCSARLLNTDDTCHAAYDVAKSAKQLLVCANSHSEI